MKPVIVATALGFLVLAFFVWWPREDTTSRTTGVRSPSMEKSGNRVRSKTAPDARNDAAGRTVQDRREAASGLWGHVRGPGGPIAGATVYAHPSDAPPHHPLGQTRTDDAGNYVLELPLRTIAVRMDVGVLYSGLRRGFRQGVLVPPGESARCDFEMERGVAIRGRVVDADGTPVEGLTLFATTTRIQGRLMTSALLDQREHRYAGRGSEYHESIGTTDSHGLFDITGLDPGSFSLVSLDYSWMVVPDIRTTAPMGDLLVTVQRALRLTGTIRDAETDEPVPRAVVQVVARLGSQPHMMMGTVLDGEIVFAWLDPSSLPLPPELKLSVEIKATGYEPYSREIRLPTAAGEKKLEVRLRRIATARLELTITFDDGSPYPRPVVVEYSRSRNSTVGGGRVRPTMVTPGLFECKLPVGSWFLHVRPGALLGDVLGTRTGTELRARAGESLRTTHTFKRGGQLEISRPDNPADKAKWALMVNRPDSYYSFDFKAPILRLYDVAPGTWELQLYRVGVAMDKKTVEVSRGQHVVVRLNGED